MLLSKPQQSRFWRDWSAACRTQGWTTRNGWSDAQIENERYSLLRRAGFDSLTQVDPLKGFDHVLAELAALAKPANIDAQLRQLDQPRRRLIYKITHMGVPEAYWRAIAKHKFATNLLENLNEPQLEMLRNTLAARLSTKRRAARADASLAACSEALPHDDQVPSANGQEWIQCPKCGSYYHPDFFCDECEVKAMERRTTESHMASAADDSNDVPF